MLKHIDKFSLPEIEEKVLKFWRGNRIFEKSVENQKGKKKFVFYEGPPYANGKPGIHHVLARVYKDIILRYKTMREFYVPRRAGWDTHGLPVEISAEKELGLKSKKDIEKIGVGKFNKKAKELVWLYKKEWEEMTERIGYWLDFKNAYITYENGYIENLWRVIKKISERKLLEKRFRVIPWCTRCGTALSSHELAQGYNEVEDTSVYVKFKVKSPKFKNTYILSWTTTPWTLPGNVALAVGGKIKYVERKINGESLIYAKDSPIAKELGGEGKELSGKSLIGLQYEPLFKIKPLRSKNSHKVYAADFVNTEEGTGVVHTAVMYGEDDYNLGKSVGLPQHHTVQEDGKFTKEVPGLSGLHVKDKKTEEKIINYLKSKNYILKTETYKHEYPFCWRCDSPVIYYAREAWFIAMSKLRAKMIQSNNGINWIPGHIKRGRFGEWLREGKDWNISRERYWGTPLPVWECEKCGGTEVLGSIEELERRAVRSTNKYILVRHTESKKNLKQVNSCWPEKKKYPLTVIGREQARELGRKLKKAKIDLIFSSDLLRAKETAEIIAKETGVKIIHNPRLRELDVGDFNDRPYGEYDRCFKYPRERFVRPVPKGESLNELRERVFGFIKFAEKEYKNKTIAVVSHGDPLWMMHAVMNGLLNEEAMEADGFKNLYPGKGKVFTAHFRDIPRNEIGELDIHRPYVDEVHFACSGPRCKGEMKRVKEVIDVWFDSGAMPFAAGVDHPADFIAEGIDQTRGWFYTLLATATAVGHKAPYKNVICLGLINDKFGRKMSKSRGNAVEPFAVLKKHGADAVRWYFYTVNPPGEPKRFDEADIVKGARQFISLLYNSFVFLETYGHQKDKNSLPITRYSKPVNILDKWILVRLHQTIDSATKNLDKYEVGAAAREIENFTGDLSRWYIRRSRRRFQKPESEKDYKGAVATLSYVLSETSKLIAPFTPFFAEAMYKSLSGGESVHLESWPKMDKKHVNKKLLDGMEEIRRVASLALAKRAEAGIKVRQPLKELRIKNYELRNKELLDILKEEVNVKNTKVDKKLKEEIMLNTEITHELKEEGWLRELVRMIQGLRQDAGLRPKDQIALLAELPEELRYVVNKNEKAFKKEIGAKIVEYRRSDKFNAELETKLDEWPIWIALRKLH